MIVTRCLCLIFSILLCPLHGEAQEPLLPPKDLRKSWSELKSDISDWTILEFKYSGMVADGGSDSFHFKTKGEKEFSVIAACRSYASAEEIEEKLQVYYLIFEGGFYKIERKSSQEEQILKLLREAKAKLQGKEYQNPALLGVLESHLRKRAYLKGEVLLKALHLGEQ